MQRLNRISLPEQLKGREDEILGEVKNGTMADCVYNRLLLDDTEPSFDPLYVELVKSTLPEFLKAHQVKDLTKSLTMPYVFNINKPGLGKTLETIMWIKLALQKDFKVLILCPKSVIGTWENQLKQYWPEYLSAGTWWITNYEQLYDEERLRRAKAFYWDCIVLDESHKIKSMKSQITQIVFQLQSRTRHCLTGTPIKNRPQDLAAQLKWLDQTSITCFTDFQWAFCDMKRDKWGWKPKGKTKNPTMVNNLQKLLNRYCVGGEDLPVTDQLKPEYIKVKLKLDPAVKQLYKKTERDEEGLIDTVGLLRAGVKVSNAIELATRRQQLASNPQKFNPEFTNVKFDWIADWLEGTEEKVVIFSKYSETIEQLQKFLLKRKIKSLTVRRTQSAIERAATVKQWASGDIQPLLGTYGVLGEGVDGLQEKCHYVIFVDRQWNASDNEQAERRIVRTGQKYQPFLYILQAIGTIDMLVERVQLDKGHDAKELLESVGE